MFTIISGFRNGMELQKTKVICSIIILSFNTKDITDRCLNEVEKSIGYFRKKEKGKIEVIVVDNASNDGSAQMIKRKYPWVKLLTQKVNTGFARGNNLGMKEAKGKYILLLNSDVFLYEETLARALTHMKTNSKYDVLGCKLTFEDGKFQPSAGYLPNPLNVFFWMIMLDKLPFIRDAIQPFHPNNESFFNSERRLGWITGAFMLLKREVFEKTSGFDESYFMYTEEVEWCRRINDKRFKIFFTPDFAAVHKKYASSNFDQQKPIIYETSGILYFFWKHYPGYLWSLRLSLYFGYSLRLLMFLFLNNSEKVHAYSRMLRSGIWKELE